MATNGTGSPKGPGHVEDPSKGSHALSTIPHPTDRIPRCRLLDAIGNRCTAEVAEPDGEIQMCIRHLSLAMIMVQRRAAEVRWSA